MLSVLSEYYTILTSLHLYVSNGYNVNVDMYLLVLLNECLIGARVKG